jgi:hypothetical protein
MITKAIKDLKRRHNIRAKVAALSVPLKPLVTQIVQTPEQFSSSITHFIEGELKNSVALSGRKLAVDFCRLGTGPLSGKSCRFLATAADQQQVTGLSKAFRDIRTKVKAVEPTDLAYVRSLCTKGVVANYENNMLIAIVERRSISLCVFRKQLLDFIRTIDIPEPQMDSEGCVRRLAAEIDAVIQFYTVELQDESTNWNTTVLMADSTPVDADAVDYLKSVLSDSDVQWLRSEEACPDIPAAKSFQTDKKPPALPVGLAMRLLEPQAGLNINLAPKESHEVKVIKRDSLIAANALAGVLVVAVLAIAALKFVASHSAAQITDRLSAPENESLSVLSAEKKAVDAGILKLSGGPEKIKNLIGLQNIDLPGLLSDLKRNTPKALQITQLNYDGRRSIIMEGRSLSYEAVRMFERMMIESQDIESVSLSETGQDEEYAGLIASVIECTVVEKEVK